MNSKLFMICASLVLDLAFFSVKGMKPDEGLLQGAQEGSLILIGSALKNGAQIEAKDSACKTALHWVARTGHLECLRVLLEKGAQIEAKDNEGRTSLHWAAVLGHQECLKVLLEKGAQIEAKDNNGETPLHWAARKDDLECLRVLLEKGAQIEAKDNKGRTSLHRAALSSCRESLTMLLEKGAQKEAKDNHGRKALHVAAERYLLRSLRVLLLAEAHVVVSGASYKILASPEDSVHLSSRRLKVALLALCYAGADADGPKSKNAAGDLIVSNDYVRPWFLLSYSGTKEDVFTVLIDLLAKGKKVDYALFRLAQNELGDYLVSKVKETVREINDLKPVSSVFGEQAVLQAVFVNLCDPNLVEENFGDLIRRAIKERFNELLGAPGSQAITSSQSSSSSQSTSSAKERIASTSR